MCHLGRVESAMVTVRCRQGAEKNGSRSGNAPQDVDETKTRQSISGKILHVFADGFPKSTSISMDNVTVCSPILTSDLGIIPESFVIYQYDCLRKSVRQLGN